MRVGTEIRDEKGECPEQIRHDPSCHPRLHLPRRKPSVLGPHPGQGSEIAGREIVTQKLRRILEIIFGCWHHDISRPFTLSGRTYEVCLVCGKQFAYIRADLGQLRAE